MTSRYLYGPPPGRWVRFWRGETGQFIMGLVAGALVFGLVLLMAYGAGSVCHG